MKRKKKLILFHRFFNGKGTISALHTIGIPSYFSTYKLSDGSLVNVHLYDTAGQEKYKSLSEQYYKKADCCLLVYDITRKKSFEECKDYYNVNLMQKCKKNVKVILLGNKADLEDKREVPSEEGAGFATENDYIFMETSCLKNTNVSDAFATLIELTNIEAKRDPDRKKGKKNKKLDKKKKKEKKNSGCCS